MTYAISKQFAILEHLVEPVRKNPGESDVDALLRILTDRAVKGWEIVESCGDEIGMPVLIFRKLPHGAAMPVYKIDEIWKFNGEDELQAVTARLWQMHDQDWLPACVLDSPFTRPIAVYKKADKSLQDRQIKLVVIPPEIFESLGNAIIYELLDQQAHHDFTLSCVMHGGLSPVLILATKNAKQPYEYLLDHAQIGIFANQSKTLADLIQRRSEDGWHVCGAFEDAFLWPCVIFKRSTEEMPVVPISISAQLENPTM